MHLHYVSYGATMWTIVFSMFSNAQSSYLIDNVQLLLEDGQLHKVNGDNQPRYAISPDAIVSELEHTLAITTYVFFGT